MLLIIQPPASYRNRYDSASIQLPPNVPEEMAGKVRKDLAGYYAHCTALDDMLGNILETLEETGLDENTLILFTSDHGTFWEVRAFTKSNNPMKNPSAFLCLFKDPISSPGSTQTLSIQRILCLPC